MVATQEDAWSAQTMFLTPFRLGPVRPDRPFDLPADRSESDRTVYVDCQLWYRSAYLATSKLKWGIQ